MGFLSSLSGIVGGGSQSQGSSQSGFALLPKEIQDAYKGYATNVTAQLPNATAAYTPLAQTAGETQAYNAINQGFTPNQQQLNSDINMQMNPYDSSVIDTINRQGQGQYSVLNQALSGAGQLGSNRGLLGANDIDLSRLQQIGTFKQGEFNTALQNALTTLPGLRAQDAGLQLGAGANQRQLALQQSSAPITGLQQIGAALSNLPQSGGSSSSQSSSLSANGTAGNIISTIGSIIGLSDRRTKENIKEIGTENGFPIYEFSYKHDSASVKYIGVMAQDIEKLMPTAVSEHEGIKMVDYSQIGVRFREAT